MISSFFAHKAQTSHSGGGKCVLEDAVDLMRHILSFFIDLPHLGEVCAAIPTVEAKQARA